jgi:hypothetical protein
MVGTSNQSVPAMVGLADPPEAEVGSGIFHMDDLSNFNGNQ